MSDRKVKFFDNVKFLSKQYGFRIGDIEKEAGVSAGYLSRVSKDDSLSVSLLDIALLLSERYRVTLDALFHYDFNSGNGNRRYIYAFVDKLLMLTDIGEISWSRNTDSNVLGEDGCIGTPHASFVAEYRAKSSVIRFYVFSVITADDEEPGYALYLKKDGRKAFVCSVNTPESALYENMENLYEAADADCQHMELDDVARSAIDTFMKENGGAGNSRKIIGKYRPLCDYLKACGAARVTMQFSQIEEVLDFGLPGSAVRLHTFWSNNATDEHPHCRAWLDAGYRTVDVSKTLADGYIVFEKSGG